VGRIFFAVRPAEDALGALAACAAGLAARRGGRAVTLDKIHLTLAFLGELAADRVAEARESADGVRARPFSLVLDRLGTFRRAGVAWAGASRAEPGLLHLQGRLAEALAARGFVLEPRPFAPHVTLVRKFTGSVEDEAMEPVAWGVTDFTLMRSETGTGRYTTEARWRLLED
jgi:2'-5' RNA ligase